MNMQIQSQFELLHAEGSATPIKGWVRGVPLEDAAHQQLRNIAAIPFVGPWVAVMPDVHLGKGATVGSVIPTRGAIIPAAVGVDIGCGMAAVRTTLRASDLPDSLAQLRNGIERSVPVGNGRGGEHWKLPDSIETRVAQSGLVERLDAIKQKHRKIRTDKLDRQIGTLGGGNHFIELCLDEADRVWVMLHSGSRGTGNLIGSYFIERARDQLAHRVLGFHLPDKDLAFFMEGEPLFDDYVEAVSWAQDYARENREAMMARVLHELRHRLPKFQLEKMAVNCHHNYVQKETHGDVDLLVTRKGAVSARAGELGIIPGSMGGEELHRARARQRGQLPQLQPRRRPRHEPHRGAPADHPGPASRGHRPRRVPQGRRRDRRVAGRVQGHRRGDGGAVRPRGDRAHAPPGAVREGVRVRKQAGALKASAADPNARPWMAGRSAGVAVAPWRATT